MTKLIIKFIRAKSTAMKNIYRFVNLFLLAGLLAVSCESYHNVSADDGVYYSDDDFASELKSDTKTKEKSHRKYILEQKKSGDQSYSSQHRDGDYSGNEQSDKQSVSSEDYYTDNPDDLTYSGGNEKQYDKDVHVYIHYDNPWFWYDPYWYWGWHRPYVRISYYYGAYDPWCDPWYDPWYDNYYVTYNYWGYPYYGYYYYYYGGYPYYNYYGGYYDGYPYVVYNNYYTYNYYRRHTNVRGPRGRSIGRVGYIATRTLRDGRSLLNTTRSGPRNHSLTDIIRTRRGSSISRVSGNDRSVRILRGNDRTLRTDRTIRGIRNDRTGTSRDHTSAGTVRGVRSGNRDRGIRVRSGRDRIRSGSSRVRLSNQYGNSATRSTINRYHSGPDRTVRTQRGFYNPRVRHRVHIRPSRSTRTVRQTRISRHISRSTGEDYHVRTSDNFRSTHTPSRSSFGSSGISRSSGFSGSSSRSGRSGSFGGTRGGRR